jgi:formate/nitrite transporter FocA (FNT family)
MSGRELFSKIGGIWWPIFGFMSLGFDHVGANMFFILMDIWQRAPKTTIGLYISKGIIPALNGNIVDRALFVTGYYFDRYHSEKRQMSMS